MYSPHPQKIKVRDSLCSVSLRGNRITGALRYGTRCKGSHGVTCHPRVYQRTVLTMPLSCRPKLTLILRTREGWKAESTKLAGSIPGLAVRRRPVATHPNTNLTLYWLTLRRSQRAIHQSVTFNERVFL